MKDLISTALRFEKGMLSLLDQQKLPTTEEWLTCRSPDEMIVCIQKLKVRGAPLIGIAAALALAHYVEQKAPLSEIMIAAKKLKAARPTAVNLVYCIEQQLQAYEATHDVQAIVQIAEKLFEEDAKLSHNLATCGANLIQPGESILTHCNTGGLISTGIGTALGAIIMAHQKGKKIHVYVDETRPLLQGARLTAWELCRAGIPHTLICDNMAAALMRDGKIQRVITGADRIAANGDSANKIGTYGVAFSAYHHNIPFHIAAPYTTVDWKCPTGSDIEIEERSDGEVKGFHGADKAICWAPEGSNVYNPAFDVTPAKYITSFIMDSGVHASIKEILK